MGDVSEVAEGVVMALESICCNCEMIGEPKRGSALPLVLALLCGERGDDRVVVLDHGGKRVRYR